MRRWVAEVRQEFAEFPNGAIRQGNLIRLASDETKKSGSRARRGSTARPHVLYAVPGGRIHWEWFRLCVLRSVRNACRQYGQRRRG